MTHSCRICAKMACLMRDKIEDCKDCVSYVWLALQEIDRKIEEEEKSFYDRLWKNQE